MYYTADSGRKKESRRMRQVKVAAIQMQCSKNPEENRPIFAHLRKLSVDIAKKNIDNITMSILSMGMTNDYQVAIEEGATMVRVGTGIFGARDYTHQV